MKNLSEEVDKLFKYGDCIDQSKLLYRQLKAEGKDPKIVEGWVEIDGYDFLPDKEFLKKYKPEEYKALAEPDYDDYTRVQQHTWVEVDDRIIDMTISQFDEFGGPIEYYKKEIYAI